MAELFVLADGCGGGGRGEYERGKHEKNFRSDGLDMAEWPRCCEEKSLSSQSERQEEVPSRGPRVWDGTGRKHDDKAKEPCCGRSMENERQKIYQNMYNNFTLTKGR